MAKSSTVIRDLRKLQEEWFKDDSPMAARIDAAIKEIESYKLSLRLYKGRCSKLRAVIIGIDDQLTSCKDIG